MVGGDVLAHVRASDDILSPRLVAMLVREEPPLPAFDDRRWGEVMGYAEADFQELLATFTFRRAELVRLLRQLTSAEWQRAGVHEARGRITPAGDAPPSRGPRGRALRSARNPVRPALARVDRLGLQVHLTASVSERTAARSAR